MARGWWTYRAARRNLAKRRGMVWQALGRREWNGADFVIVNERSMPRRRREMKEAA